MQAQMPIVHSLSSQTILPTIAGGCKEASCYIIPGLCAYIAEISIIKIKKNGN
jgi:hypothetical protein